MAMGLRHKPTRNRIDSHDGMSNPVRRALLWRRDPRIEHRNPYRSLALTLKRRPLRTNVEVIDCAREIMPNMSDAGEKRCRNVERSIFKRL
jgi:hypothetical protein